MGIPVVNIGMVGHIDHGKTTLLAALTGKWASTHSEELKRGITIRLGYSEMTVYECPKGELTNNPTCPSHKLKCKQRRCISFVDAPGHETLMATMLSGASVMDAAILVIAANEKCPQPQTKEHLAALNVMGIKNIIIVQNKIDLVSEEEAKKSYEDIKAFVKGSIAENAPIIPVSAQHNANIDILIEAIEEFIKTPKRDLKKPPIMLVSRSFDVNKPGTEIKDLKGGVLGGILKQGVLKKGEDIIIRPGLRREEGGKIEYKPIKTKIESIFYGSKEVNEAVPGGNFGISTLLDPSLTKSDELAGSVVCTPSYCPPVFSDELIIKPELLKRVVGTEQELAQEELKLNEPLLINALTAKTVGTIIKISGEEVTLRLKLPICIERGERVAISRFINNKWRLVGSGIVI